MRTRALALLVALALAGCATGPANNLQRAIAAEQRGDHAEAIRLYTLSIAASGKPDDPGLAAIYNLRSVAYVNQRQYDAAIADSNEAIRLKPDYAEAYNNRGEAYARNHQPDLALEDFDVALRLKPKNPIALQNRGFAHFAKGENDLAIADFDGAIALKADDWPAFIGRGTAQLRQGELGRAIADFDAAIRLKPEAVDARDDRGFAYAAKGDYDKALADFDAIIRLQPDYAGGYLSRGVLRLALGQAKEAGEDLSHYVKRAGPLPYATLWLHLARRKSGVEDGEEFQRNAATGDQSRWPGPIVALYLEQVTPEQLRDSLSPAPQAQRFFDCQTSYYVGEYALLHGDRAAAEAQMRIAVGSCAPDSPEAILSRNELARLGG